MPTYEITTPDGTFEVTAPNEGAALQALGGSGTGERPRHAETLKSSPWDIGTEFMSEINRNLISGSLPALADRTAEALTGYSPGVELAGGSYDDPRWYERNVFTRDKPEPETPGERIAERAGQYTAEGGKFLAGLFAGGAGAGAGAARFGARPPLLRPGQTYEQVAKGVDKRAPAMGREAIEQAATRFLTGPGRAPVATTAAELSGSAAAGAGGQLGREYSDTPEAEMGGALVGGLAGSVAPTAVAGRYGARKVRDVVNLFRKGEQARQAKGQVGEFVREQMDPASREAVGATQRLREDIPGARFSLAEATEKPSLMRTQEVLDATRSGAPLDAEVARRRRNLAAVEQAKETFAPGAGTAEQATTAAQRRIDRLFGRIGQEEQGLTARAQDIATDVRTGPKAARGREVRELFMGRERAAKQDMNEIAGQMGLNDPEPRYDATPLRTRLREAVEPARNVPFEDDIPKEIMDKIERIPDTVSLEWLRNLRTSILTQQAKADAAGPFRQLESQYYRRLSGAVDEAIEAAVGPGSPEAQRFREFSNVYRERFADVFRRGPALDVLAKARDRGYKYRDEEIAGRFFKANDERAADQYRKVFGDSPEAAAAMEGAVLDDLYGAAATDLGELSPQKLATWIRRHRNVFEQFPGIAAKVDSVDGAVRAIGNRRTQLTQRRRAIESDQLQRELAAVERGTRQPEQVVMDAVQSPVRMTQLVRSMKTPEAKSALARSVWEAALGQNDPAAFIQKHRSGIVQAIGEDAFDNARKVAEAYRKATLLREPTGAALNMNPFEQMEGILGTGIAPILSRAFAAESGRVSYRFSIMNLIGISARKNAERVAKNTLTEAMYDADLAEQVAQMYAAPRQTPEKVGRFMVRLWQAGLVPFGEDEPAGVGP